MSAPALAHDSLAEIHEDKLVDRVVTFWGRDFFQLHGMASGMMNRQCVPLQTAPGALKGDIDVLFSAPSIPEQAVAYQAKRIKFGINQLRNGTPGKLQELKKLAQQANLLARMGFWQVYAYFIVVVDARQQNAEEENARKMTFEGLSSEMRSKVYSAVSFATQFFEARVGLGVMDFTQTMDSEPFTVGTHGLHRIRPAQPATQSEELTKWVVDVFTH